MKVSTNSWSALKEHPIVIVLGFCAATAAATAAIYEKLIIPYQLKSLEVQAADLQRQLASMPANARLAAEKDKTIQQLKNEILSAKQRSLELTKENIFSAEDPYPKSFRNIRIGDPFKKLDQTYPGKVKKEDPDDSFASIEVDDFFFPTVTYYYDRLAKQPRVTRILFHVKQTPSASELSSAGISSVTRLLEEETKINVGVLKKQISEKYGDGTAGKKQTTWKVRGINLILRDDGSLILHAS